MSDGRKYYCICDSNCKFETMTKEQILAAIAQAVETGKIGNCDAGFITKVKEQNSGGYVTFWVGTQASYNALDNIEQNCLYIITDDTTESDIMNSLQDIKETESDIQNDLRDIHEAVSANSKVSLTALQEAQKAQQAINALRESVKSSDLTSAVTFKRTGGGGDLTTKTLTPVRYVYDGKARIMYFTVQFTFAGALDAYSYVDFKQSGGYLPDSIDGGLCFVGSQLDLHCKVTSTGISIFTETAFDTKTVTFGATFTGFYYCDGV